MIRSNGDLAIALILGIMMLAGAYILLNQVLLLLANGVGPG